MIKVEPLEPTIDNLHSGNAETLKDAHQYLFDNDGGLIKSAVLKTGKATLKTSAETTEYKSTVIDSAGLSKKFTRRRLISSGYW